MDLKRKWSPSARLAVVSVLVSLGALTVGSLDEINANTQPGRTEGANNLIHNGEVSSNENPAEIIAGTLDPSVGTAPITKSSDWVTGFQGEAVITNDTSNTISCWSVTFEADFTIDQIWHAEIVSHSGTAYVLKGMAYNNTIEPGGQVSFGFIASPGSSAMPVNFAVNGGESSAGDGTGTGDDTGEIKQCSGTTYGSRMLKLLTRVEYQNSIEDLVGIGFNVSDAIPFDGLIEGYFNKAFVPVTENHVDAYMIAAEKVAAWSAEHNFAGVVDCGFDGGGNASVSDQECESRFLNDFAFRVFRRPLTSAELSIYQTVFDDNLTGGDIRAGLELGITALLTSPQFLYRSEAGTAVEDLPAGDAGMKVSDSIGLAGLDSGAYVLGDYEVAGFLSYTLTGSTPDQELLTAVKNDELGTQAQIGQQIKRLLATDRAREHLGFSPPSGWVPTRS